MVCLDEPSSEIVGLAGELELERDSVAPVAEQSADAKVGALVSEISSKVTGPARLFAGQHSE